MKLSLTQSIIGSSWLSPGLIAHPDGSLSKAFEADPLSSGVLEESFDGDITENYFAKLADLLTKLPNGFEGQMLLCRRALSTSEVPGFRTTLYCFERVPKAGSYSHFQALLAEAGLQSEPLAHEGWSSLLSGIWGDSVHSGKIPDVVWREEGLSAGGRSVRALSLTELPQVTWKGCLQSLFEHPCDLTLSLRLTVPERSKIRRQLETKRRISHALSVSSSAEVRNIESNSVLHSSEETLERILVGKETLFEISLGILLAGKDAEKAAKELEHVVSGIGNAGVYLETIGTLPVVKSHIPGNKMLGIRKLPILSENLAHFLPLFHDFSRANDSSSLSLRSRSGEVCHLNLFSGSNLNFNAFICGTSGSGKSFLMNAILSSALQDDPKTRICIFDVGGSYRKIIQANGGQTTALSAVEALSLISTFLKIHPVDAGGFYRTFVQALCGSGPHITHSHQVAIDDLVKGMEGERLSIKRMIQTAGERPERFYQDIAHWLKPHAGLDDKDERADLIELIRSPVTSFDFKALDADPVLQRTTILLLTELLWRDLSSGHHARTIVVFDEVWRFFAQSKGFLEEMYRTFRKYRAGIVSITQNLADYGDEAFAKMLFTNSFTKIFLQSGASAEYLKNTFDLPPSDIERALSVVSKKPHYSEFFALTPTMRQVFRLYPTKDFYALANTENITERK